MAKLKPLYMALRHRVKKGDPAKMGVECTPLNPARYEQVAEASQFPWDWGFERVRNSPTKKSEITQLTGHVAPGRV